ncbi:MAG: hypothetical protein HC842_02415 [Cytophagales bacterium]|nr:hypothetical protein [Cytophagales bacterium]
MGVPIPLDYYTQFRATNMQYAQDGDTLFLCGGYTGADTSAAYFNFTSPVFLALSVSGIIRYIRAGGDFNACKYYAFEDPRVQVSGGEMEKVGSNFYLAGGQTTILYIHLEETVFIPKKFEYLLLPRARSTSITHILAPPNPTNTTVAILA